MKRIYKKVFNKISKKNYKISFAESVTGGNLALTFIKNQGASKHLQYSVITYSNLAKMKELNVDEMTIEEHGVVSPNVSLEMAKGLSVKFNADIYVSITGEAGINEDSEVKELSSFATIIFKEKVKTYQIYTKNKNRVKNIETITKKVYKLLNKIVK